MKLVFFTTILIFLMVAILPVILSMGIRKIPNGFQPALNDSQAIEKNISIRQSFRQQNDNLSGIGLSIKNPYYRNTKDLFFDLYDDQSQLIRRVKLNGKNIADGNFLIIGFDPIRESVNKFFSFTLNAPDVESAQSLEVYHSQQLPQDGGVYLVNNQPKEGTIAFVSYTKPTSVLKMPIFVYQQWLTKLFQDLPFFTLYGLVIILGFGYLIKEFRKRPI